MGRATLLKMALQGLEAAGKYIRPRNLTQVRRGAMDRWGTILRAPSETDGIRSWWHRVRDSKWQFDEELKQLGFAGQHTRTKRLIDINPATGAPESAGVHEIAHDVYSDIWEPKHRRMWDKAVKKYGRPVYDDENPYIYLAQKELQPHLKKIRSHPFLGKTDNYARTIAGRPMPSGRNSAERQFYKDAALKEAHFKANTESLAFTMQEILTPGKEITAPVGMLRAVERIFDARGLIDRVAHRLPLPRR